MDSQESTLNPYSQRKLPLVFHSSWESFKNHVELQKPTSKRLREFLLNFERELQCSNEN